MYGSTNPLVPLTGFGMTAGASVMAGYPLVALGISLVATALGGVLLVRLRTAKKRSV
jgi:hypothetical protein